MSSTGSFEENQELLKDGNDLIPGGNLQPAQHRASTASGLPALA